MSISISTLNIDWGQFALIKLLPFPWSMMFYVNVLTDQNLGSLADKIHIS